MKAKHIIITLWIVICLIGIVQGMQWRKINPFGTYTLQQMIYAGGDCEGNIYALEQSGKSLVKINKDGVLCWRKKAFYGATQVVCDEEGSVFVLDYEVKKGVRIISERVSVLDSNGNFVEDAVKYEYEKPIISSTVINVTPEKEGFSSFLRTTNGLTRTKYPENDTTFYKISQANRFVRSVAWYPEGEKLYYSTYEGKIFMYVEGGEDLLLYDSDSNGEFSIPSYIGCDDSGMIYCADIGTRKVFKLDPDTKEVDILPEDDEDSWAEIAYTVDVNYGLIACTGSTIKTWENDEVSYISDCKFNLVYRCRLLFFWISVISAVVLAVYAAFVGGFYVVNKASVFTKIVVCMVSLVLLVSTLIVVILIPKFMKQYTDTIFARAQMASAMTVDRLPYESFENLKKASDFMKEDYLAVKSCVDDIFFMDDDSISDLYCALYSITDQDIIALNYTMDNCGAVYPYDWEFEGSDEQEIITTQKGKTYMMQAREGSYLFVLNPIIDDNGKSIGLIEVGTDLESVMIQCYEMIADVFITVAALMVVLILLIMEIIYFGKGKTLYDRKFKEVGKRAMIPAEILRMITFMIFFLTNLATSFLPVYAMQISEKSMTFGLPAEVLAAIPISAEVLFGAIFSVFGASICNRLGNKRAVILSSLVFTFAFILRLVPDIWILTFSNALLGFGWAIILLLINTKIATMPEQEKNMGFSHYNTAEMNGVNSGVVFGGFLIQWMSYKMLFIVTAVLSLIVLVLVKSYLSNDDVNVDDEEKGSIGTLKFLFHPRILGYFLLMLVPVVACGYFLNYMYPIVGSRWGLSETYVGYSYLLNGLCVMILSGGLTKVFRKKKVHGLVLSVLLYAVAFVLVGHFQNILSLFAALILLGVSDSFGLPLQTSHYTDDELVQKYGFDRSMGIYSLFENGAQAAGSFVFSYVLITGVKSGLYVLAGIVAVLAVVYGLSSIVLRRKAKVSSS